MQIWHQLVAKLPEDSSSEFDKWLRAVPDGYVPLLEPSLKAQAAALEASVESIAFSGALSQAEPLRLRRGTITRAEVFRHGDELFVAALRVRPTMLRATSASDIRAEVDHSVLLCYLGASVTTDPIDQLRRSLGAALGVELRAMPSRSARFDAVISETELQSAVQCTPEEQRGAQVLCDHLARQIALAVKSSSGLLVRDIPKAVGGDVEAKSIDQARKELSSAALINDEAVVVCTKSATQVTRVPNAKVLPNLAAQGVRCSCGKPIDQERIEEALAVTELATGLLDKSRWMSLIVVDELIRLGIDRNRIYLEFVAGGDEVDCLADVYGRLALFELKDKTFSLGDAYSFGAKIAIFEPDIPVIVTTEHVGGDAKDHFTRSRGSRRQPPPGSQDRDEAHELVYVEGMINLRARLEEIVTVVSRQRSQTILRDALSLAAVSPDALIDALAGPRPRARRAAKPARAHQTGPQERARSS